MAEPFFHLKIDPFFKSKEYVYPKPGGGGDFPIAERDRAIHGNKVIQQLNKIREQFAINKEEHLPQNIVRDDAIYVEFFSEWNFPLKFESLNQEADEPKYQVLNIKREVIIENDEEKERFKVVVMMKEGAVSTFLKKAGEYLTQNTKDKDKNDTGLPAHRSLISNIENIELATLKSFWSDEPEIPFPQEDEVLWWEVWFRRTNSDKYRIQRVLSNLEIIGAQVGKNELTFPEHTVKVVKATAKQLSSSLILLDNLAELRKPQQLNDFITGPNVDLEDKQAWVEDLIKRTEYHTDENSVVICLLDSGVNNKHPLLTKILPDKRLYTLKESWGTEDTWSNGGHGTGMSGLALYGDLTEALSTTHNIKIYHGVESFKIIHPADPNDPDLYGAITEYACNAPVVDFPNNPRIYCLAITDSKLAFNGRPSTWSAAIDKLTFGNSDPFAPQLFIISGGNVNYIIPEHNATHFPDRNYYESIHDPAQSYNALTVGTYTRMDRIDQKVWPGVVPLAKNGSMSPSNSTSLMWDSQWPIKPDVVMEGGNLGVDGSSLMDNIPTLKPLSLDKDFTNYILYPFGDTSGAAALASKMAAEIRTAYPKLWPETIKALMVHSADWTEQMLNGINFNSANVSEKRNLLRTYGFGVPILEKALHSAKNSLTLIAENFIQPYRLDGASVRYNEFHLYEIPWPIDILQNYLTEKDVRLKLTLSYFIDPNPGNRRYANNFSYHSHSLDFKMIKPTEDLDQFKRRISGAEENQKTPYNGEDEPWFLKDAVRNRGSIKKDFLISSGADLATRNIVAIYPKIGWYNSRKRLGMVETKVRYSLIISIEADNIDIDIYNPVFQLIQDTIPST